MSEPKWTPGPWRVETKAGGRHELQIWDDNDRPFSVWICAMRCGAAPAEEEHNAHLLAASPLLYEALAFIASGMPDDSEEHCVILRRPLPALIRAALAAARGEQP